MTRDEMVTVLEGVLGLMTTQAERSPAALAGVMAVLAALLAEPPPADTAAPMPPMPKILPCDMVQHGYYGAPEWAGVYSVVEDGPRTLIETTHPFHLRPGQVEAIARNGRVLWRRGSR